MTKIKSLCVFCGASAGSDPRFAQAAVEIGTLLAQRGITLVYGGGKVGLMGLAAQAALANGGKVIGVIPKALATREVCFSEVSELHVANSMHERKALMAERSDGFVALPGGIGTLEEFFEIWTWAQLGFHQKPVGLYNVAGFFDRLIEFLDQSVVSSGFVEPRSRAIVTVATSAAQILERFETYQPADIRRYVTAGDL